MSYSDEMNAFAHAIKDILQRDDGIRPEDVACALEAQSSAIELVDAMLTGNARLTEPRYSSLEILEANPTHLLAHAVRSHPRLRDMAPSESLGRTPRSEERDLWIRVANHSAAALAYWQRDGMKDRQSPPQAWATVADAAAIAGCLADLDARLVAALKAAGRDADAELYEGTTSLRSVSTATSDLAAYGSFANVDDLAIARLHPVRNADDFARSQATIAQLVDQADEIRPKQIVHVAKAQIQMAVLLSRRFGESARGPWETLRSYVSALDDVVTEPLRVQSCRPDDERPLQQSQVSFDYLRTVRDPAVAADLGEALVQGARKVVASLSTAVDRQESSGRWLQPNFSQRTQFWSSHFAQPSDLANVCATAAARLKRDDRFGHAKPVVAAPREILPTPTVVPRARPERPSIAVGSWRNLPQPPSGDREHLSRQRARPQSSIAGPRQARGLR